jgi:AraC-like DNA-binding protein
MVRYGFARLTDLSGGLAVGLSRMPADAIEWSTVTVGPDHHLVFSYVSQRVTFEGAGTMVVTPNEAVLCPSWTAYRRHTLHAGEEVTVFVAVTPECAEALELDDALAGGPAQLRPVPAGASLAAWQLVHRLGHVDPDGRADLEHTERAAELVAQVVPGTAADAGGVAVAGGERALRPRTQVQRRRLADAVREHLAVSFRDPTLSLRQLGHDVGASPHHLARVFRAATGRSIHDYRTDLRLRFVLARLPEDVRLSDLAMDAGFSTPGHLSDMFRRRFAVTPSRLRARLRGPGEPFEHESGSRPGGPSVASSRLEGGPCPTRRPTPRTNTRTPSARSASA